MADKQINSASDGLNLPYSLDAEQAVIGSVLLEPECISRVMTILHGEYFYVPQNREIFSIFIELDNGGKRADPLVVLEMLKDRGVFDDAAGKAYLAELAQMVPSTANVETYCNIVKDKYFLRALIEISRDTIDAAISGADEADTVLDSAEQRIYDIRKGKTGSAPKRIFDVISNEVYPTLRNITSDNAEDFKGIPTGFADLDDAISGLNRSDLILIGARPAMGKTSFALNIARNVAMRHKTVVFFSLEMSNEQLATRVLATEARVESNKLRSGKISLEEWISIGEAANSLMDVNLYFDDTSTITVPEMKAKIRRMRNVDCVIVDYLGLMQSAKKTDNRVQEVTEITRSLKLMAKDLKIPVVVCSQLSRGPEKNKAGGKTTTNRPSMSDLRDSGSTEQDADIVLLLYREGYYYKKGEMDSDEIDMTRADLDIAKNRHGPTTRIELHWEAQFTKFSTMERKYEDNAPPY